MANKPPRDPETTALERAAADWFARLRSEACTEAERARFAAWLAAAPQHRIEYARVERLWDMLGTYDIDRLPALASAPARPGSRARRWAAAALAMSLIWMWWQGWPLERHYLTPVGGRETVVLEDGTRLELNTDTEIGVRYTPSSRALSLVRGEVYLEVTPIPERPLIVAAGAGEIRVLGTRFLVRHLPQTVTVALVEGAVEVRSGAARAPIRLRPGESLSYDREGRQGQPENLLLDGLLAWRRGELVFRDTPMAEVAATLERYHPARILLAGPELKRARVSGVFRIGNLRSIATALADSLDAKLDWIGNDQVLITQATQRGTR